MSTVRIDPESHLRLKRLARAEKASLQAVLEKALRYYEKARFFEQLQDDFARLDADPEAAAQYRAEHAAWDATLAEGWP